MKTEAELNQEILEATLKIKKYSPELEKYIGEMPVTIPDANKADSALVNNKNLSDYLNSLKEVLRKYEEGKEIQFKLNM
ncbi:hypothetical protein M3O96_20145 [Aquiflexum sp. TKW24L]|uniref:hypothetical protein n=1 Tax=Aquiflexum sp. TKW24L TaxID=2942212 RepID=UPI0020BE235F|nr:hypothetical protein [Aquiflexum sp. TKW24L]MCL6261422.1 hypothetical protein [Aquiflexum sp. TKW24L]